MSAVRSVRRAGFAVVASLAAVAGLASSAGAADSMYIDVENRLTTPVALTGTSTDCWYPQGFADVTIPANATTRVFTQTRKSLSSNCDVRDHQLAFQAFAVAPSSQARTQLPLSLPGAPLPQLAVGRDLDSPPPTLSGIPTAPVPAGQLPPTLWAPVPLSSGGGLACIGWQKGDGTRGDGPAGEQPVSRMIIDRTLSGSCTIDNDKAPLQPPAPNEQTVTSGEFDATLQQLADPVTRAATRARRAGAGDAEAGIYDFGYLLDQACLFVRTDASSCNQGAVAANNDFSILGNQGYTAVDNVTFSNPTSYSKPTTITLSGNDLDGGGVEFDFSRSYTAGQSTTTAVTRGFTFQFGISNTFNIGSGTSMFSRDSFSVTFNFTWNWSTTKTTQNDQTSGYTYTTKVTAPGKASDYTVLVIQDEGAVSTGASADITLGDDGASGDPFAGETTQVITPYGWLNYMAATPNQTCIGYLAGQSAASRAAGSPPPPYSLQDVAAAIQRSGTEPTPAQLDFLTGVSQVSGTSTACQGFPANYASALTFSGLSTAEGSASFTLQTCAYVKGGANTPTIDSSNTRTSGAGGDDKSSCPGTPPSEEGDVVGPWIDAADRPAALLTVGTPGPDYLSGDRLPDRDRLLGRAGDDVLQGLAGPERLLGGPGDDIAMGGAGADQLLGGPGDDALQGQAGPDLLVDSRGRNSLDGGPGADVLRTGAAADSLLEGGPGDDRLIAAGGRANMLGGRGDDVYILRPATRRPGRVDYRVAERRDEGFDVVRSYVSTRVPDFVERFRLMGDADRSVVGTPDGDVIVGNGGDNVLDGGPGRDRVIGAGGDDVIVLSDFGYDVVTGGPGRDRFVVRSAAPADERSAFVGRPARRTGHLITDFTPGRDRIVLRRGDVGEGVTTLRRAFRLVAAPGATPRDAAPTLLLDTRSALLTYDADGAGPGADRVLARLPGVTTLSPRDIHLVG